jgi:proteasome lid subunit RPN8/RPN11
MGPEDELVTTTYSTEILAHLAALCEGDPNREVCGFLVQREEALQVVPVTNVADRYHAVDPERFPRTSREAYVMDAKEQLRLHFDLEAHGGRIVAIWHSHIDVGAYFSEKDRTDAIIGGLPAMPGAEYLVLGVRAGRVTEVKRFRWDGGEFVDAPLPSELARALAHR